ncbi:LEAF RUST 10 DISEASE-RESISTANCE LOCUS RECEPTOR-LIKE PROTEIN KINASE-like 1.2 [Bienertia sinuspersici]
MYDNKSLPTYFLIIFFIISIFLPLFSSTLNQHYEYDDCFPIRSSCGFELKIAYPFWDSRQQDYCGHPAFKLDCSEDDENSSLTIDINNQTYKILSINYETKAFTISKPQFSSGACPPKLNQLINTTIDMNIFNFTSNSQNVTLFYDCVSTKLDDNPPYAFSCSIDSFMEVPVTVNNSLGFLAVDKTWEQVLRKSCNFEIYVPVLKAAALKIRKGESDIETLFSKGFEVKWMVEEDGHCKECVNSGGRCGFNHTLNEPTCLCEDGANYERSCGSSPHVENNSTGMYFLSCVKILWASYG